MSPLQEVDNGGQDARPLGRCCVNSAQSRGQKIIFEQIVNERRRRRIVPCSLGMCTKSVLCRECGAAAAQSCLARFIAGNTSLLVIGRGVARTQTRHL